MWGSKPAPHHLGVLVEHCQFPQRVPLFSALRMAYPDTRIVDYYAAIGGKIPVPPCVRPWPSYLSDLLHPVKSPRSSRSVASQRLQTQRTRTRQARFLCRSSAAPTVWNLLPVQDSVVPYRLLRNSRCVRAVHVCLKS